MIFSPPDTVGVEVELVGTLSNAVLQFGSWLSLSVRLIPTHTTETARGRMNREDAKNAK